MFLLNDQAFPAKAGRVKPGINIATQMSPDFPSWCEALPPHTMISDVGNRSKPAFTSQVTLVSIQTLFCSVFWPVFFFCWATVADGGPTLKQHWLNVSCLLGIPAQCLGLRSNTQVLLEQSADTSWFTNDMPSQVTFSSPSFTEPCRSKQW